ncbi:hypothetical protein P20652_4050 [Pseudoalteromonas sp. BSi20652]|nr:hypothetical protein P20652_4050 [Pseudoalteromonas sp. BSi20652]
MFNAYKHLTIYRDYCTIANTKLTTGDRPLTNKTTSNILIVMGVKNNF